MPHKIDHKLAALITEARAIAAARPACHLTLNDMMAIELLNRVHQDEPMTDLAMVEGCVERMRIARATDRYPRHMLARMNPSSNS